MKATTLNLHHPSSFALALQVYTLAMHNEACEIQANEVEKSETYVCLLYTDSHVVCMLGINHV